MGNDLRGLPESAKAQERMSDLSYAAEQVLVLFDSDIIQAIPMHASDVTDIMEELRTALRFARINDSTSTIK